MDLDELAEGDSEAYKLPAAIKEIKEAYKAAQTSAQVSEEQLSKNAKQRMDIMEQAKNDVELLERLLRECYGVYSKSKSGNTNDQVVLLSYVHKNMVGLQKLFSVLEKNQKLINEIERLMKEDDTQKKRENMLFVHYYLMSVEHFRINLEMEGKVHTTALADFCDKVDRLSFKFSSYVLKYTENILEYSKKTPHSVIHLMKIVEVEDSREIKTDKITKGLKSTKKSVLEYSRMNKWYSLRKKKYLGTRLLDNVSVYIDRRCSRLKDLNPLNVCDETSFVFEDLDAANTHVAPLFPPRYKIVQFYAMSYHRHVCEAVHKHLDTDDAKELLSLLTFEKRYKQTLKKYVEIDSLTPDVLLEKTNELNDKLLIEIKNKTQAWMQSWYKLEAQYFIERNRAPELDEENHFFSSSFLNLIPILRNQLELASCNEPLYASCLKSIYELLKRWLKELRSVVRTETQNFAEKKTTGGLDDYLQALGNSCLKAVDFFTELENVPQAAQESLKQLNVALFDLASFTADCLQIVVMETVQPAAQKLFTKEWYTECPIDIVIVTFSDFFRDFSKRLHPVLFAKTVSSVLTEFVLCYLNSAHSKNAYIDRTVCGNRARTDMRKLGVFFSKHIEVKRINAVIEPAESLINLISAQKELLGYEYGEAVKLYGNISPSYLKKTLLKRNDFDAEDVSELMDAIRSQKSDFTAVGSSIYAKLS